MKKVTVTYNHKQEIKTLISCINERCTGCLNGNVDVKELCINFRCNECGVDAGYFAIEENNQ